VNTKSRPLSDGNGALITSNDDWKTNQEQIIAATGGRSRIGDSRNLEPGQLHRHRTRRE